MKRSGTTKFGGSRTGVLWTRGAALAVALAGMILGACAPRNDGTETSGGSPPPAADGVGMAAAANGWTGALSEEAFKALHAPVSDEPTPALHGTMVDLAGGRAYLSLPAGAGPHPGLVVIQEWWGLNDHIKHWADRLAADGYAALAVDLFDGKVAVDRDEAFQLVSSVNEGRVMEILAAGHAFLKSDPRVAAPTTGSIGWCFGGAWSLRLAIAEPDLDAAVIYYGRLVDDPAQLGRIGAKICGIFGTQDEGIPPAAVASFDAALTAAAVEHEIHSYDAAHAFANPSNSIYDEKNAAAAWEVVRAFLAKHVKAETAPDSAG